MSNWKRDGKQPEGASSSSVTPKDNTLISHFFEKSTARKVSGWDIFTRENKGALSGRADEVKAPGKENARGLHNVIKKAAFDELSETAREEYHLRAAKENAENAKAHVTDLNDLQVAE